MDSRILVDPHSSPSGFINPYPDPSSSVDLPSKKKSSLRDQLQLEQHQQQQVNTTQMDPVYSQFLQTDPFVKYQEHSRTRTVPLLETFIEKDISYLQLPQQHQQQQRNLTQMDPVYSQFLQTDPSVRYQEHSRTRTLQVLGTFIEKDLSYLQLPQQQQQQQRNPTQMDPVYSQFFQTDPLVRYQEHSRTRTVPVQGTFNEKDILHQQQERNPTLSQFYPTDPPVRSQDHSRTRTLPVLETISNEKDVSLIAAIDKRTVLRGLVREYIDPRRGILEIYQVGHSGLLSEPVAGSFNDLTC